MRQGSTCLPWEPPRCSSYQRSHLSSNVPEQKDIAQQIPQITTKQPCLESFRSLPTRSKAAQPAYQTKQSYCSIEENKSRHSSKGQIDVVKPSSLLLNRPASTVEVNVARSRCHPRRRPCTGDSVSTTPKLRRDTDCTESIVRLIVFFSTKLVHTIWSQASATPKSSKDFNGAGVLPLQVFIQETLRRSKTSYSTLQVALFYLILLRPHVHPGQATQQQYAPGCRALQCGRRMFLTALILASKYLQDRNYSARAWSKISGLPVAEINENERYYLELIKYNLHMSKETFENWSKVVLSICKASGQSSPGRYDSPPSSPEGLSFSAESDHPGSPNWWAYHLSRLAPGVVTTSKATEEYLAGLATSGPFPVPSLSLDTPPASPESLEELLNDGSSPVVLPASGLAQTPVTVQNAEIVQSPASMGSAPSRPLLQNLPTPQTTPRYDSAFTFSRSSSQSDLRCRASLQALVGVEKQAVAAANLETCPPPKPRLCGNGPSTAAHPLREMADSSSVSWLSSPESSFSDSSSNTTRSRSSSMSSVSSVWSVPGTCPRSVDVKPLTSLRAEVRPSSLCNQLQSRANVGSYSFYHPVSNMHSIPEENKAGAKRPVVQSTPQFSLSHEDRPLNNGDDLSDDQIARLLASLSSESSAKPRNCPDSAAISDSNVLCSSQSGISPSKKHKRNRSSKGDCGLQDEVRQFLWNERNEVYVEDDKIPTTYVETLDKEAQYPLQHWAHARKPVSNALQTKRIALQHSSSEEKNAPELATDFLRQSVAVM